MLGLSLLLVVTLLLDGGELLLHFEELGVFVRDSRVFQLLVFLQEVSRSTSSRHTSINVEWTGQGIIQ